MSGQKHHVGKSTDNTAAPPVRRPRVKYSFLNILTGSDLSQRRLPVMNIRSDTPGPVVWLTACGHGDEVGGIIIVQEVFKKLRKALQCGTVHAFPLMNPMGLDTTSRNITISREDLNRLFPGDAHGTLGERIAHLIFTHISATGPSLVLDLHNDWIKSIPYVVIDAEPGGADNTGHEEAVRFSRHTGLYCIRETEALKKTLSYTLLQHGTPALTLEMGEPCIVNETNINYGVKALWNLFMHLGMVAEEEEPFSYPMPAPYDEGMILRYSDRPYSTRSGIVRFLVTPGSRVKTGQPIAKIVNAFGKHLETMRAIDDAIVLGHSDSSVVFPGMHVMSFGVFEHGT
jgi:predicted deacylase